MIDINNGTDSPRLVQQEVIDGAVVVEFLVFQTLSIKSFNDIPWFN